MAIRPYDFSPAPLHPCTSAPLLLPTRGNPRIYGGERKVQLIMFTYLKILFGDSEFSTHQFREEGVAGFG